MYKDLHASSRSHLSSHHKSKTRANDFLNVMQCNMLNVLKQANSELQIQIEYNRQKLKPIISSILLCATRDLSRRRKMTTSRIFYNFVNFRIELGDEISKKHNTSCEKCQTYITSNAKLNYFYMQKINLKLNS